MKLATGNMFNHPASLTLVTTNSYIRSDGGLVMGRGAADGLKKYFPMCEFAFGAKLGHQSNGRLYFNYGIITIGSWGIFQVKYHFLKPAVTDLIELSVEQLCRIAPQYHSISLNFPGIGNGGLPREIVLPLIEKLPDNVTVWELP